MLMLVSFSDLVISLRENISSEKNISFIEKYSFHAYPRSISKGTICCSKSEVRILSSLRTVAPAPRRIASSGNCRINHPRRLLNARHAFQHVTHGIRVILPINYGLFNALKVICTYTILIKITRCFHLFSLLLKRSESLLIWKFRLKIVTSHDSDVAFLLTTDWNNISFTNVNK